MRNFIRKLCNNLAYDNNYEFIKERVIKFNKNRKYLYEDYNYYFIKNSKIFVNVNDCKKCNSFSFIKQSFKDKVEYILCSDCK
jgi:hypothetical protein